MYTERIKLGNTQGKGRRQLFATLKKKYVGRVIRENKTFYGDGLKPLTSSSYLGCNSTNAGFSVLVRPSAVLPPALIQDWAYFFR